MSPPTVLLATMELVSVSVAIFRMPPPPPLAELPLTVQLARAMVPALLTPPPAELPLRVQLVSVSVPVLPLLTPPPLAPAELPLTVQLVRASVPRFCTPPPILELPPVIVSPERAALTPASTWNTRLSPPPL